MAYDCKRWCHDCDKEYDGHDMDKHVCPSCEKIKAEEAKMDYLHKKSEFMAQFAHMSTPAAIQELAAYIFDMKNE